MSTSAALPGLMSYPGFSQKSGNTIWLSNGRQIQRLEFQESSSTNHMPGVAVTRWERNKPFDQSSVKYNCLMWSRNSTRGYQAAGINFQYPSDDEVNWNNLDYLIVGYQTNLTRAMKYWRTRYILIPVDQLGNDTIFNSKTSPHMSAEDIRIANFEQFLDHILNFLRNDEREGLERKFLAALPDDMKKIVYSRHRHRQQQQR
ncbi:vacuolar membrane-associated protein iml1, partial [Linderina pennispora]